MKTQTQTPFGQTFTDKAIVFGTTEVEKIKRYPSWKPIENKVPSFVMIKKNELRVDQAYQRETANKALIKKITAEFNWLSFGCLCVALRQDGWYVIDGAHRLAGALSRADVSSVPCLVFEYQSIESEATAFVEINCSRRSMATFDLFKAKCVSNDEDSKSLFEFIESHGIKISKSGANSADRLSCIGTILAAWKDDRAQTERIFKLALRIHGSKPIDGNLFKGLIQLDKDCNGLNNSKSEKLIALGSEALKQEIRRHCILIGKSSPTIWAQAIAKASRKRI